MKGKTLSNIYPGRRVKPFCCGSSGLDQTEPIRTFRAVALKAGVPKHCTLQPLDGFQTIHMVTNGSRCCYIQAEDEREAFMKDESE
jgi:hypothetical protein